MSNISVSKLRKTRLLILLVSCHYKFTVKSLYKINQQLLWIYNKLYTSIQVNIHVYCIIHVSGFICALLVLITQTLGIWLLYHTKTKVRNQQPISMSFWLFPLLTATLLIIRDIYCLIYKYNKSIDIIKRKLNTFVYTQIVILSVWAYVMLFYCFTCNGPSNSNSDAI